MTKILVIEDEEAIRENILELLEVEEFTAISASNGQIGIKLAKTEKPDLIICDVMMPEQDGYEVLRELRSHPNTATIPVIFLTAKADRSDTRKGMELGADDYLPKPCTSAELIKAITARLAKQEIIDKQAEERLNELRNNISYFLPHELRTPLNGILGFADLILNELNTNNREELDIANLRRMAEAIKKSGTRLSSLIQNFLLYAELEMTATNSERLESFRNSRINSSENVIKNTALLIAKKYDRQDNLEFDLKDTPVAIAGNRLAKIVEELVDNACKFSTAKTPIKINSYIEDDKMILSVADQGRGMTPEYIDKIGAYMQFERKIYEQQGSGLGLIIVKRLAELHQGEMRIESLPKTTTVVTVILPIPID